FDGRGNSRSTRSAGRSDNRGSGVHDALRSGRGYGEVAMDTISKNRWQIRGAALVIFLFGFAAGALVFNAYHRWTGAGMQDPRQGFERMLDRLQLSGEQKTQVQQIFSETREQLQTLRKESEPRFDEIRRQTDERLQK